MSLYCNITGVSSIYVLQVSVSSTHGASSAVASFETIGLYHTLGQHITIDLGYSTSHRQLFTGYVKSIEHSVPDGTYTITANDDLVRAADFFIVSSNPAAPLTYINITGEALVRAILELSGLSSFSLGTTYFTFGVSNEFEVQQVSSFDFAKGIASLLTWEIWCDENGVINFKNRKPFVMSGSEPQPDWVNDSDIAYTWDDNTKVLQATYSKDENNLRNKVVVYGYNGLYASAEDGGTPYFKWKTAVLADAGLIDTISVAQDTADYNLHLLNRITETISATVIGDSTLMPFRTIHVDSDFLGEHASYYIFSAEHSMDRSGYTTKLELKK
jgi:hypothetical protein